MKPDEIVWTVSEVNRAVKEMVEGSLMPFYLTGEVGSISSYGSGHVYMTLKDERSQLRAAYFGGAAVCRQLKIANGDRVECFGKLGVYEVRGEYQFIVRSIRPAGQGELQRRFDELKTRLNAEGLFEPSRKKPLPAIPQRIGLVTSPNGAALRDFMTVLWRRFPGLRVKLYPAQVQGSGCALSVAQGVAFFNRTRSVDVIVVCRGGGSMEDLWGFNDEQLARTIAASAIPVVSAVGHEIDFTIADFVADLRAATPSAAAELIAGSRADLEMSLDRARRDLQNHLEMHLERSRRRLQDLQLRLRKYEPRHHVEMQMQFLDETRQTMRHLLSRALERAQSRVELLASRTAAVDPGTVLRRGYALLFDESGTVVKSSRQPSGRLLRARLTDGEMTLETK